MAKDRNTFAKRQREADKKRKADQKRKRRAARKNSPDELPATEESTSLSAPTTDIESLAPEGD